MRCRLILDGFGVCKWEPVASPFSKNGSPISSVGSPSLDIVSTEAVSDFSAAFVAGSGSGRVPVTMSASQSPKPPGAASTAV